MNISKTNIDFNLGLLVEMNIENCIKSFMKHHVGHCHR